MKKTFIGDSVLIFSQIGVWSVVGKMNNFTVHIKVILSEYTNQYCVIDYQSLALKMIPTVLKTMFDEVVKIANLIKSRQFNSRILRSLHDKIGDS